MFLLPCKLTIGKNSQAIVEWLNKIQSKNNASLIVFDFESFYPSKLLELFHKAINFVKTIRDASEKDISIIIMQSIGSNGIRIHDLVLTMQML